MKVLKVERRKSRVLLLGSFGCLATGVSIRKLHNLMLCHPIKSIVAVLQAIGRMLRTHSTKEVAHIFDFVDDFRVSSSHKATFVDHGAKRYGYYKAKGHAVQTIPVDKTAWDLNTQEVLGMILAESEIRLENKRKLSELQQK